MLTKQFAILYISFVVLTKCLSCAKFQEPIKYDNLPQQQALGTYSHAAQKLGYNIFYVVKPHSFGILVSSPHYSEHRLYVFFV